METRPGALVDGASAVAHCALTSVAVSFRSNSSTFSLVRDNAVVRVRGRDEAARVATAMFAQLGADRVAALLPPSVTANEPAEVLIDAMSAQLLDGTLVLLKEDQPARLLDAPQPTALSDLVEPEAPPSVLQTTWFAVRIVDRIGTPLSGVEVLFDHGDGRRGVTTDATGWARVDDVPWRSATVSVPPDEALNAAIDSAWADASPEPSLVAEPGRDVLYYRDAALGPVRLRAATEHTISVQPFVVHSQMLGMLFETDRDFLLPVSLTALAELRALYERCTPCRLLVVGHTDTSGQAAHNDALSLRRAESVRAFVTDDVEAWLARYGEAIPKSQRWGDGEDQQMLAALPDAADRPPQEPAMAWFQRTRGLPSDALEATRRALIAQSMAHDGTSLPPGVSVETHGCGERFPLNELGVAIDEAPTDGDDDPLDRRVELFFFGDSRGVQPPPPGPHSPSGSTEYPTWRARAHETYAHVFGAQSLEIVLHDDTGVPIPNARYTVALAAGSRLDGELDHAGSARLTRLPAGPVHVDFPDLAQGFDVESSRGL